MKVVSKNYINFLMLVLIGMICISMIITLKIKTNSDLEDDDIEFEAPTLKKQKVAKAVIKKREVETKKKGDDAPAEKPKDGLTLHQKWDKLFKVKRDVLVECNEPKIPLEKKDEEGEVIKEGAGTLVISPFKAPDTYTPKDFGFGRSAYFYDYLDETLMKPIVDEFAKNWKESQALIPKDADYADPYALATMLLGKQRKMNDVNAGENKELIIKLKLIYPKFDEAIWLKSIDAFKINELIKEWKWDLPAGTVNPAKSLIDNFDFNGDGRLNIREFTLASIITNQKIYGSGQCTHCFEETIKNLIDPIFYYCDCDGDGRVTAEELWKGLKLVKQSSHYNFYKCIIKNTFFRTSAINDFMLKGSILKSGQLSVNEFRQAILLGYWNRHTTLDAVVQDSSLSKRDSLRWPNGKDFGCEEMERNIEAEKAEKSEKSKKDCKMKKSIF